jgi:hypothetical protein
LQDLFGIWGMLWACRIWNQVFLISRRIFRIWCRRLILGRKMVVKLKLLPCFYPAIIGNLIVLWNSRIWKWCCKMPISLMINCKRIRFIMRLIIIKISISKIF